MAKSKKTASKPVDKSGKRYQSTDEAMPMKKQPKMEKEELTPEVFMEKIMHAAADVDHDEIVRVLSMNTTDVTFKLSESDCTDMLTSVLWSFDEEYGECTDEVVDCMRALLNDDRTSYVTGHIIDELCQDVRDMCAVLELIITRHPHEFCERLQEHNLWGAIVWGKDYLVKFLISQPFINVNYPQRYHTFDHALHCAIANHWGADMHMPGTSPIVPILLAHPQLMPDLRDKVKFGDRVVYCTALAIADNAYATALEVIGESRAAMKKRCALNVRLLLDDDRVDVHQMEMCSVDEGY